ncbi:USP34 [Symbiodinium sp. KB8]|nr:USP34 [Symbiodinium sp. KB8]
MQALVLDRVHLPALSSALRHIIWTAAGGLAPGIVNLADSAQLLEAALSLWVGVISTSAALVEASVFGEADTAGGPDGPSMVKSGLLCKGVYGLAVRKEFAHALGEITRVQFADDPAGALRQRVFDTLLALMPGAGTSADPEQDTGHFAELFTVLTKTLSTILATGKSGDSARAVDMFDRFASSLLAHRSAEWDPVVLQGARSRGREVLEHTPYLSEWDAAAAGGPDALASKLHTAGQDDGVLCGLLGLLTSLVRGNAALQSRAVSAHAEAAACVPQTAAKLAADADGSNLVELVFYACLLGVPGRPAGDSPPPKVKCQRSASRLAALDLLAALCEGHLQNTDRIPESAKGLSGHNPCTDTRGKSGYVGIRNLGAICYMLSVVQQLFGMPRVRQAFLDMPVSKPGEEADPLMERLSWVFNTLHLSDKAYVDIKSMVSTYTDRSGEAVDPSQQQDAIDFFDVLTDHIEQRLGADSDLASTIKDETQLRQLYDMVGEVPAAALPPDVVEGLPAGRDGKVIVRRRRRADPPALCTGCDVKNLNSLKDSLNKACEWSDVDYRWDEEAGDVEVPEDAKITTRQRLVLDGSLPPTLILQARRFQFDFETMQPDKLNTRFEFPRNLDMRPFTVHALEYDGTAEGEAPPAWHFHYEVSGVVVHRGTATHGHYFSFVRDRRREYREERGRIVPVSFDGEAEVHVRRVPPSEQCWYRADDTNVVEVTMSDTFLEAECFGGRKEEVQTTDLGAAFTRDVDNMSNAYLLFYSRVQPEEEGGCDVEPLVAASPTAQLARAANHSFAVERAVFSPELLSFAGSQMVRGLGEFGDAVPEHWFRLAFTWAFGVLAPSASNGPLEASVVPTLVSWLESSSPALAASGAKWVLDQVAHQPEMHLGQLLRSLDGSVRNSCMAVLCTAVQVYVASDLAAGDAASIEAEAAALTALRQGGGLEAAKAALGADWRPCTFSRFLSAVLSMIPSAGQDWSRFEQFFGVLRCAALKTPVAFGRTLLAARGAVALLLHFYMAQGNGDVVVHWDIASGNVLLPLMAGSPPPAFPYLDDPKKRLPLGTASLTPSWGPLLQIVAGTVAVSHSAGSADGACTLPALDKVMLGATRAPTAEGAAMFEAVQDGLALRRAAARAPSPPAAGAEPGEDTPAGAAMGADTPPGTAEDGATERECALEGNCVSGGDVAWDKARAVSQRMVDLCPSVPPHPMPVTTQDAPGDHALLHLWPADLRALAMPAVYTKALRKAAPAGRPAATAAEAVLGDKPGAAGEGVVHAVCVIATRLSVEAPGFSDMVLTEALQVLADCTRGQSDVLKEDEWLTHAGAVAAGEGSAAAAHSSTVTQWSAAWDVVASLVALQDSLQGQRVADVLGDTSLDGSKGVVAQAWQKRLDCAPTVATSSNRKTFDIVRRLLALSQAVPALLGPLATIPLQEPAHTTHAQWMVEHTRTLADYATTCASGSKEAGWAAPGEMQPPPVTRVVKHTKREDPGVVIVRQVEVTDPLDPKGPYLAFEITNQHEHARPLAARMNWRVVDAYRNYNYTFPQTDQEAVVPVGETVEVYRSYKVDPSLPFDSRFTEWSYTWKLV